jgi:hypothetical protein
LFQGCPYLTENNFIQSDKYNDAFLISELRCQRPLLTIEPSRGVLALTVMMSYLSVKTNVNYSTKKKVKKRP